MSTEKWWSIRDPKKRAAAKAAAELFEQSASPRASCPGPGKRRGAHYVSHLGIQHRFTNPAEELWAKLISCTNYRPLDPSRFVPELRDGQLFIRDLRDKSLVPVPNDAHPRITVATIQFLLGEDNA